MKALGWIIGIIFLAGVIFAACFATIHKDDNSLGRLQLVSHYRGDCDPDWDGDCGDYNSGGDYGRDRYSGGGNGNRGRRGDSQRGDKNCHSFCGNTIVIPDPTKKDGPPPDEQPQGFACLVPVPFHCDQPASLFPPTPDKIIAGFQTMLDAGIKFGTTIAQLTGDFVTTVFRFVI